MKRMMSWTPTPSHLMKQMPRKRGPRHKGLEGTKWNDEISYLGSEKLMSFWAIFLVLHFASLICGNPLFGCYKGGEHPNIYIYILQSSLLITAFPFKNHNWIILEVSSPGARLSMILCILLSLQTLHICLRPQLHGKIMMASMEVSWNFLFE